MSKNFEDLGDMSVKQKDNGDASVSIAMDDF